MNWLKRLLGKTPPPSVSIPEPTVTAPSGLAVASAPAAAADVPAPDFPFPLVAVPGASAEREWKRLNASWRGEGASAVVLGDREEVDNRRESMKHDEDTVAAIIAAAALTSADQFFAQRQQEYSDDDLDLADEEWPEEQVAPTALTAHTDILSGNPKPIVYIARVPTALPWEIPAYLKVGGWNDCPTAAEQVSVLRHWTQRHQIEIYSVTGDVIECIAGRPPATRAEAMKLAREQFLYCSDIVHQGTQGLSVLAASLLNSPTWFFWWD